MSIVDGDQFIDSNDIGIDNVNLQDTAGCYAYHILRAYFYIITKKITPLSKKVWTNISVLDFAPSILNKFNIKIPSYMNKEKLFEY